MHHKGKWSKRETLDNKGLYIESYVSKADNPHSSGAGRDYLN